MGRQWGAAARRTLLGIGERGGEERTCSGEELSHATLCADGTRGVDLVAGD
jgi:hypothetical protein